MKTLKDLRNENPSGLLPVRTPLTRNEYREALGFRLRMGFEIFESAFMRYQDEDFFAFPGTTEKKLEKLFLIDSQLEKERPVVIVVESSKDGKIHCELVLSDAAFRGMLAEKEKGRRTILRAEQFYLDCLLEQITCPAQ